MKNSSDRNGIVVSIFGISVRITGRTAVLALISAMVFLCAPPQADLTNWLSVLKTIAMGA